jgi:hypothetical protein
MKYLYLPASTFCNVLGSSSAFAWIQISHLNNPSVTSLKIQASFSVVRATFSHDIYKVWYQNVPFSYHYQMEINLWGSKSVFVIILTLLLIKVGKKKIVFIATESEKYIILTLFYDQNYVNLSNLKFHPLLSILTCINFLQYIIPRICRIQGRREGLIKNNIYPPPKTSSWLSPI